MGSSVLLDLPDIELIHVDTLNEMQFLEIKNQIAVLMSKKAGIVRSGEKLIEAINELNAISKQLPEKVTEYNLLKIKHITDICTLICESALIRTESRGGHIRKDFQLEDSSLCAHLIQQRGQKYKFQEIRT
jgi:L-aspartate oxidase